MADVENENEGYASLEEAEAAKEFEAHTEFGGDLNKTESEVAELGEEESRPTPREAHESWRDGFHRNVRELVDASRFFRNIAFPSVTLGTLVTMYGDKLSVAQMNSPIENVAIASAIGAGFTAALEIPDVIEKLRMLPEKMEQRKKEFREHCLYWIDAYRSNVEREQKYLDEYDKKNPDNPEGKRYSINCLNTTKKDLGRELKGLNYWTKRYEKKFGPLPENQQQKEVA